MNCDIRWAASTNNKLPRTKVIDDHGGAIIFADLIDKLYAPHKSGPSKAWLKIKNPNAPAATRAADGTF
jgi:hypothetical protein